MVRLSDFDTIIFDFGGVILDIDPDLSRRRFAEMLGIENARKLEAEQLPQLYEKGLISRAEFVSRINQIAGTQLSADEILSAWNAMLLNYKPARIEWIKRLHTTHRLLLLSNTNDSHFEYFHNKLIAEYGVTFYQLFDHVYLSHEMGMLKPSHEIYETVIAEQQLNLQRTLFIEDTARNVAGAQEVGLQTLLIPRNGEFYEFFGE
ncbi:MAG: HAD-IA family hydrolase [Salinivirgaceae bacterium]|nr:HAD-IA family hydrolase [Salinivirgaceae bacterium]